MPLFQDPSRRAMSLSFAVALLMLAGKGTAFVLTGSAAILSDAAESVVHVLSTAFVAFGLWYAMRPADADHPYGHGKAAYFAAGFEGTLLVGASLLIAVTAVYGLWQGTNLERLGTGLWLVGVLGLTNGALGYYLVRTGRRHRNLILVANGQHVLADMWTSLGVVIGVGLVWITGLGWLDPLIALVMAAHVAWMGVRLLREAVGGLMERVDPQVHEAILEVLDAAAGRALIRGYHQLRHRRINNQVWVEYHVQFRDGISLAKAHDRAHTVEEALREALAPDTVVVTAHLEPEGHDDAHPDGHREPEDPLVTYGSPT